MAWKIRFIKENSIIYIQCIGLLGYSDFIEITKAAAALAQEKKANRFLLDNREAETQISPGQIYEFPKLYELMKIKKDSKCGLLRKKGDINNESVRFFETVCLNNGYSVKIFHEKEKAVKWLCEM